MSRKNHNSILFLTTVGVYLGLVLVGATPQVLAQAATAKQFTIRETAGNRDDLDKKPGDDSAEDVASGRFDLVEIEKFLAALDDLNRRSRFDLLAHAFKVSQNALQPAVADAQNLIFSSQAEPIRTTVADTAFIHPIAEHTVIVTRLPRGSLDTLPASNAK